MFIELKIKITSRKVVTRHILRSVCPSIYSDATERLLVKGSVGTLCPLTCESAQVAVTQVRGLLSARGLQAAEVRLDRISGTQCFSLAPSASLFSPVDYSRPTKGNWTACRVLLAQSCSGPHVQAL